MVSRPVSRLSPGGGANWMHSVGHGALDESDPLWLLCQRCPYLSRSLTALIAHADSEHPGWRETRGYDN